MFCSLLTFEIIYGLHHSVIYDLLIYGLHLSVISDLLNAFVWSPSLSYIYIRIFVLCFSILCYSVCLVVLQ